MSQLAQRLLLALALVLLAGCTTVYVPRYSDQGVYYDDPAYATAPVRSDFDRAWAVNPVHYPYWSLDYFYFSQHYHPYSVVVGGWAPYFYPFPGWYFGHRAWVRPGLSVSVAFGNPWWGYPWHGHGFWWRPVHYGYFGGWYGHGHYRYGHHHRHHDHPGVRDNDRLRALQRRESSASRQYLLAQRGGGYSRSAFRSEYALDRTVRQAQKVGTTRQSGIQSRGRDASRTALRSTTASTSSAPTSRSRATIQSRSRAATTRTAPTRTERRRIDPPVTAPRASSRSAVRTRPATSGASRSTARTVYRNTAPRAIPGRSVRAVESGRVRAAPRPTTRGQRMAESRSRAAPPAVRRVEPRVRSAPPPRSRAVQSRPRAAAPPRASAPRPAAPVRRPAPSAAPPRATNRSSSRVESRRSSGGRERIRGRRDSGGRGQR